MIKIFLDSDVILDLLARREPNYIFSVQLFTLLDEQKVEGYTSPLVFANLHYLLRKQLSQTQTIKHLKTLKTLVAVLPINDEIIEQSLNSDFKDFEDAIQYFAAVNNNVDVIITRNKKDYKAAEIPVVTAEEFVKSLMLNN